MRWARKADVYLWDVAHRFCPEVEKAHLKKKRVYAHTFHDGKNVCWCQDAMTDLNPNQLAGICLHEYGHLLAGNRKSGYEAEKAADLVLMERFGIEMSYRGKNLIQWVNFKKVMRGI